MTAISATQVKELRQMTGVGMMECKKALEENSGNLDKAVLWLRERGMSRAAQKSGRTAAEGIVECLVSDDRTKAAVLELNCETDFSAKNEEFRNFAAQVVKVALAEQANDVEALGKCKFEGSTVGEKLTALIAKVGENMTLRRVRFVHMPNGFVNSYNHMGGKIGVLVAFEGPKDEKALELGSDLAMHVAASSPRYFDADAVTPTELQQEKDLALKKLQEQGKTGDLADKILVGQMQKFYAEVCFLNQPFVKEPKLSIAQHIKQTGLKVAPKSFVRFQLGEGIEVQKGNFADEVAAQLNR